MKALIESESSSKHEYDFVTGSVELSVCCFWEEFSCLGDPAQVMQGRDGCEDRLGVRHGISSVVGTSSPFSFAELFRALPRGYTPARLMK